MADGLYKTLPMAAAELGEADDAHPWSDLSRASVDLARRLGARKASPNDLEQAKHGAFLHRWMARVG